MIEFIDWSTLDFKRNTGTEKMRCPNCDERRTDKRDKSLVVYHKDGVGKCFYCDALTFKDSKEDTSYKTPNQDYGNYTNLSDNLVKYFKGRGISQKTLNQLVITEEKYYQPSKQKEVNNIVFNYFEGGRIVNKKYRSADKKFTQSAGTKNIFYNINSLIGQKECYIVEGEIDVLSFHEIGIQNVISVPNGANDKDDVWDNSKEYLKNIERFIIAVDNDEKGNELKEKIAQRLGRWKCDFIEFESGKDANECLTNGSLKKEVENRKVFPVGGTYTTSDLLSGMLDLHRNGLPPTIKVNSDCFGDKFNETFTVMRGHLCTVTGIPSHGKSTFTEWYALNLMNDNNMKLSFFSPEHNPMELHQTSFAQKALGKPFFREIEGITKATENDVRRYVKWADQRLYLTGPEKGETPTWEWLLDKFKEQMYAYGVDCFYIDAFNKVRLPSGMNKIDAINSVLTDLTNFAQAYNVVVFLIAHPTKMQKKEDGSYTAPTLYDVSGSADFRNQTHDGFCIHRTFENDNEDGYTTFINLKTKMSFQGKIGDTFDFKYDNPTGRYYPRFANQLPRFDMTVPKVEQIKIEDPMKPFDPDEGGMIDEVPF